MKRLDKITTTGSGLMPLACVLSLVLLICGLNRGGHSNDMAEARYLPTRSDASEIEALKSIIKQLLVEAAASSNRQQATFQPRIGVQDSIDSLRSPNYLQRRAAEVSVASSNGADSDGAILMGPMTQVEKNKNTMQLFRPANEMDGR